MFRCSTHFRITRAGTCLLFQYVGQPWPEIPDSISRETHPRKKQDRGQSPPLDDAKSRWNRASCVACVESTIPDGKATCLPRGCGVFTNGRVFTNAALCARIALDVTDDSVGLHCRHLMTGGRSVTSDGCDNRFPPPPRCSSFRKSFDFVRFRPWIGRSIQYMLI